MTWFASSLVMPHALHADEGAGGSLVAPRRLCKLSDVHGREG
jgi:hypothetical protein